MTRVKLGRTGIEVSDYCLGTMTWGRKTPEAEAHRQMDTALEHGIDFLDTAEMYPVHPVEVETVGRTEEIIGNWIRAGGDRHRWVIATKAAGEGGKARGGEPITAKSLRRAVEGSLRRLGVETIDLYQFHWPNRGSYHFRKYWRFDPRTQPDAQSIRDEMHGVAATLGELVQEGKIRAFGLSNDSAWGTMNWLEAARATGGPRVTTMQNEYSLICRIYDTDMAELSHHEDITLISFSPLAGGMLTGKYSGGALPEGSRGAAEALGGRLTDRAIQAVDAYVAIAKAHGIDPVAMALEWQRHRPFPVIPIFGATTHDQLERILEGRGTTLSKDVLEAIETTHKAWPMPM